ncbi:MAG: hypothetical protein NZ741_08695 [Armatimonadetes bacterium]|nr:hypothetical protein [Armatimonadota bacterium]
MRKRARYALFLIVTIVVMLVALRWWQSPRLDRSTPATQGACTLRRVYVAKDEYSTFRPARGIVLELEVAQTSLTTRPYALPLRVVTADGTEEIVEAVEVWHAQPPRGGWQALRYWVASWFRLAGERPPLVRAYIPLAYPSSTPYLDVSAPASVAQGGYWRIVNLPRAKHALPPPVQVADRFGCKDFEIRAHVRPEPASLSSSEAPSVQIITDAQVKHPPAPNLKFFVALKGVTPEWAPAVPLLPREELVSQDVVTARTARTVHLLRLPFYGGQRSLRLECEGWLAREEKDMRVLRLPVQRITTASGSSLLVIAPPQRTVVHLPGGSVMLPGVAELAQLPEAQALSPCDRRAFLFYQKELRSPHGAHSLDVVAVLPQPGGAGRSFPAQSQLGGAAERIAVTFPSAKALPREVLVYLWGGREVWRSTKHSFTLTLQVKK